MRTDAPAGIKSPVKYYVTYDANGQFSYYDKQGGANLKFDTFEFVLVEVKNSVSGWNKKEKARVTSRIFNSVEDPISVRCNNKELYKGTWKEGKAEIKAAGGKFCNNLFCMGRLDGGELEPINFQVMGTAAQTWMDFSKENTVRKLYGGKVVCSKGEHVVDGRTEYHKLVMAFEAADVADLAAADRFAVEELKPYLEQGQ